MPRPRAQICRRLNVKAHGRVSAARSSPLGTGFAKEDFRDAGKLSVKKVQYIAVDNIRDVRQCRRGNRRSAGGRNGGARCL